MWFACTCHNFSQLASMPACKSERFCMADWQLQSQGCRFGQLQKEVSMEKCVMCLGGIIVAGGKILRNSAQGRSFSKKEWLRRQPPRVLLLDLEETGKTVSSRFFFFYLKPRGPLVHSQLTLFFYVSDCLLWILPDFFLRSTISTQFVLLRHHVVLCISCSHLVEKTLPFRRSYTDPHYHSYHRIPFIECPLLY